MRIDFQRSSGRSYDWVVAFEDGYFKFEDKLKGLSKTVLVGVQCYKLTPVNVGIELIEVDGLDATDKAIEILKKFKDIDVIFLGGITYAGFNIIDPVRVYKEFNRPIVVVTIRPPNDELIIDTLKRHFRDADVRIGVLKSFRLKSKVLEVQVRNSRMYIQPLGLDFDVAKRIVSNYTVFSNRPEQLKLAKIIASSVGRMMYCSF